MITKGAFREALALEPRLAASAAIARRGERRDYALKPVLGVGSRGCGYVARELFAEFQRACFIELKQLSHLSPALDQWTIPQILAVEMEKVKSIKISL
jgi:hypothetical protein